MYSFYLAPDQLDLVLVSGPDAVKFLQGQLTCDVQALAEHTFIPGAACNNKGRVYATFLIVQHADMYFLVFNKGVGQLFTAALKKYQPFYKCTLQAAPAEWLCLGVVGTAAAEALAGNVGALPAANTCAAINGGWMCGLHEQQYLFCTGLPQQTDLLAAAAVAVPQGNMNDWLVAGMQAGHFPFIPEDAEKYTPQELNLEHRGYISFSKGCYTGQEIVARMHYRGKVKKQLYLLQADTHTEEMLRSGIDICDESGVALGHTLKQLATRTGALVVLALLPVELANKTDKLFSTEGETLSLQSF